MIGFLWGRERERLDDDRGNLRVSYDLAARFRDWFVGEYGGVQRRAVQLRVYGRIFDLWDREDRQRFEEAGAHNDKRPEVVGHAAAQAVQVMIAEMKRQGISPASFAHLADTPASLP